MSIVCVSIVFVADAFRTEPYLDTKIRKVRYVKRPTAAPPTPSDAGVSDARDFDAALAE